MTPRSIQWIADSGLLVGLTLIGEFCAQPELAALSLSTLDFMQGVAASGAILGATAGSTITADGLAPGVTINPAPGWAYDGAGPAGVSTIVLTETLSRAANSPRTTSIAVSIASSGTALDLSSPDNSGLIAALRSF